MRRTIGILAGAAALVVAVVLGAITIIGETERQGAHGEGEAKAPPVREVASSGVRLTVDVRPEHGKVGEVVQITGRLVDASTGEAVRNVQYQLVAWHLEDDVPVFRTRIGSADGTFRWGHQFWDGTEHEVRIIAQPGEGASRQFPALTLRRVVEVEAVPPAIFVQVRALLYLVAITAVGLVVGIQIGLRVRRPAVAPRAQPAEA